MGVASIYSGIIPTRFLTLLAHLIILIVLLWDKDEQLRLCLHTFDERHAVGLQNEYVLSLGLSTSFLVVEFLGFLTGVSMFTALHSAFSIVCHCTAAFTWSFSYIDEWDCATPFYWWIFAFCSTLPLLSEIFVVMQFLCCRKLICN